MSVNLEALRELRRVVREQPVEHFNMAFWECRTAVCAFGAACNDAWFQGQGLRNDCGPAYRNRYGYQAAALLFGLSDDDCEWLFNPLKYGVWIDNRTTRKEVMAACAFITREMVIERIDAMMAKHTPAIEYDFSHLLVPELELA